MEQVGRPMPTPICRPIFARDVVGVLVIMRRERRALGHFSLWQRGIVYVPVLFLAAPFALAQTGAPDTKTPAAPQSKAAPVVAPSKEHEPPAEKNAARPPAAKGGQPSARTPN